MGILGMWPIIRLVLPLVGHSLNPTPCIMPPLPLHTAGAPSPVADKQLQELGVRVASSTPAAPAAQQQ